MAIVGISALNPDLVVLDEFQRFKDLLRPDPGDFIAELAHRLFNHVDPRTGRPTRTLLLSATPYRMYTTADEPDADHYEDFLATCSVPLRSRRGSRAAAAGALGRAARCAYLYRLARRRGSDLCGACVRVAVCHGADRAARRHTRP